MILSHLSQSSRYATLHPLFPRAFDYIRDTDLFALAPGRYNIVGDNLIAIIEQVPGKTKAMARLEAHRRYIDIQLVLEGDETDGLEAAGGLPESRERAQHGKRHPLLPRCPASWIAMPPDAFLHFLPGRCACAAGGRWHDT